MSTPDDTSREDDLTALAASARQGSAGDFQLLANRVRARLAAWANTLSTDGDDADELTQLTLIRMHERIAQFDGRSRFSTWLYRLTRNLALDMHRSASRRANIEQRAVTSIDVRQDAAADEDGTAARFDEVLRTFRNELSRREREVFEMVDLRGLSAADAAIRLGITPSTTRGLLLRARRKLRSKMMNDVEPGGSE